MYTVGRDNDLTNRYRLEAGRSVKMSRYNICSRLGILGDERLHSPGELSLVVVNIRGYQRCLPCSSPERQATRLPAINSLWGQKEGGGGGTRRQKNARLLAVEENHAQLVFSDSS